MGQAANLGAVIALAASATLVNAQSAEDIDLTTRIGECSLAAVQAIDIPEAGTYHTRSFHEDGSLERQTAERIFNDVYIDDNGLDTNTIFMNIKSEDPNSVLIYAEHEGTNGPKIDAARTKIGLEFDGTSVTSRWSGAAADEFGVGPTETIHGQWTIAAAQTAENEFIKCMGFENHPDRPETSAVEVGEAPGLYEYVAPEAQ